MFNRPLQARGYRKNMAMGEIDHFRILGGQSSGSSCPGTSQEHLRPSPLPREQSLGVSHAKSDAV